MIVKANTSTKPTSVFISYNKADGDTAREIALFLIAENINVWFDEWEIAFGESIVHGMNAGLGTCTHFIILWSQHASNSNWVTRELESALTKNTQTGSPRIIPILLDFTPLPDLLLAYKYISPYHGGTEEDRLKIVRAISGHLPSNNFIRAIVKKYHEVIRIKNPEEPFNLTACPDCGNPDLKGDSIIDYEGDETYYTLTCEECGWSDWSQ